jgi:hypothetical protein
MLRRGTRTWRFATPVVAAVQLAAVTFVPVAHPFLHDRHDAATAVARPTLTLPSNERDLQRVDVCLACLASPGMAVPQGVEPEACPRISRAPIASRSDGDLPARPVSRGNRERAPPLS